MTRRCAPLPRARAVPRRAVAVLALATLLALAPVLAGCIPSDGGEVAEVDDGSGAAERVRTPPVFPAAGPVPPELVVQGLEFDLSDGPNDLSLWVASPAEARCTAERVVATIGASRLVELGYLPDTPGSGLTELALTDAERSTVVTLFSGCVDLPLAVGSLIAGNGQVEPTAAACIADGLEARGQLRPFVESWAFVEPMDPFADDAALSDALSDLSVVCLPGDAFTWFDTELPGDPPVDGVRPAAPTTTPSAPRPVVPAPADGGAS